MVLPLLAGSLGAIYSVGKGIDTVRFWSDYKKNTGYSPRYPFRSGMMDWMKMGAGSMYAFGKGIKRF